MASRFEEMSKDELLAALEKLTADPRLQRTSDETQRLIHDLEVHQIELEMQNRELRDTYDQLNASRARYADLYDHAPIGYLSVEENGMILEANLTAAVLLGLDRGHLRGRFLRGFVEERDRRGLMNDIRRCAASKIPISLVVTLRPQGAPRMVTQVVGTPFADARTGARGCRVTLTDISALDRSQERLRLLADAGVVLASSLSYAETIGEVARLVVPSLADVCLVDLLEADSELVRSHAILDPPWLARFGELARAYSPSTRSAQAAVLQSREPVLLVDCSINALGSAIVPNTELRAKLQKTKQRSLLSVPLLARERILGVLTFAVIDSGRSYTGEDLRIAQELAARFAMAIDNARLYQTAQKAITARDDLLAVVSHDLRNPLSSVMMNAEVLAMSAAEGSEWKGRKQVAAILREAERMSRMISDLLDLSRIEAGRLPMTRQEQDVGQLLRDAVEMLTPLAKQKQQQLSATAPVCPAQVLCDRERMAQVLSNLLGNAIKFTPPGGAITVSAEAQPPMVEFAVTDDGPGIPEDQRRHLFERYWQPRDTARKGAGLGLYIAKCIVEAHGGRICVEDRPDGGARFLFTLPLVEQPSDVPWTTGPAERIAGDDGEAHILVVDDQADAREAVSLVLEANGYHVEQAANGKEALERLKSGPAPSLILLDLMMPVMNGWQLGEELRKDPVLSAIPLVIISGAQNLDHEAEALGAAGCLRKPIRTEALLRTIEARRR